MREDTTLWCGKFQMCRRDGTKRARVKKRTDDAATKTTIAAMLTDKTKAVNYFKFAGALLTSDGPLRDCNRREIRFFDVPATVEGNTNAT